MANDLDLLTSDLTNYVVAPLAAFGIGGFGFDSDGESTAHLSADITDHYTEDNRAIQDHVAIRPKKITLKGFVGEVVYNTSSDISQIVQQLAQKLTTISAFLPTLSASATQMQSALISADPLQSLSDISLSDASNIYGLVKNIIGSFGPEAKQQNAYLYFKALLTEKILMGVQTPWEFIPNMLIESVDAIQSDVTISITDFSVTLKEARFAQTLTVAYSNNLQGQNSQPASSPQGTQGITNSLGYAGNYPQIQSVETQTLDGTPTLQGAAAVQSADPVTIGNIPGVALPSNTLPGAQGQMTGVVNLIPPTPASALTAPTGGPSLSSVFQYLPIPAHP